MNSWVKYAWIAIAAILLANCNASKKASFGGHKIHKIDSLPATIIAPVNKKENSIFLTDTTSRTRLDEMGLSALTTENKKSEIINFNSEMASILKNGRFAHIIFQDLKIAVDDFRNNNYLNPDF